MTFDRITALRTIPLLAVTIGLTGCLSPLQKQTTALAAATAPVVDQAAAAYRAANALYDTSVDYEAVRAFDRDNPVYNPKNITVLLPERDIQIRLKVLQAVQLYVQNIAAITSDTNSAALQAASKAVGQNLAGLGTDLAPSFNITSSTATTYTTSSVNNITGAVNNATITNTSAASPVTPVMRNAAGTAADALGQFLVSRKIKRRLPAIILKMDPQLKQLCDLLTSDIDILQPREQRDYDTLIDLQTLFIRTSPTLSPEARRSEIMKLPAIVRQGRTADAQLTALRASITNLYLTHHALAAVAQGNNPHSLKQNVAALEAAGSNLGTFYASLSSK